MPRFLEINKLIGWWCLCRRATAIRSMSEDISGRVLRAIVLVLPLGHSQLSRTRVNLVLSLANRDVALEGFYHFTCLIIFHADNARASRSARDIRISKAAPDLLSF